MEFVLISMSVALQQSGIEESNKDSYDTKFNQTTQLPEINEKANNCDPAELCVATCGASCVATACGISCAVTGV
ncbi:hypothetical protein GCM10009006_35980 [Haloarcula argentinensis]|uniref:Uncharacterized protein n=1 Tax=Haloarcula argentinensis TaxID=43776 RepID=A0A830FWG7_HALAR|nr:hypothetical protein GCM10009006_35980 [Haloarcula argentinensis]